LSGSEQLSIGFRYFHEGQNEVQESFVGFGEIKTLDAKSIDNAIDDFLTKADLSPVKCVGLGFEGCSTMASSEIQESFIFSLFVALTKFSHRRA